MDESEILPNVKEVLSFLLKQEIPIALGSASKNAQPILEKVGLLSYFSTIVDGNNVTKAKPDPEVFIKAAQGLGLKNESCIVVEDAIAGLEAAKTCGMTTIGYGDAKDSELSDHKLEKFSDLINLIGSI